MKVPWGILNERAVKRGGYKECDILDEALTSSVNGIGTFLLQLVRCLRSIANVCVIGFNAPTKEFVMGRWKGIQWMEFPLFLQGNFIVNVDIIRFFFLMYVADNSNNVFFINHFPCTDLMSVIKKTFPFSKVVFAIHDLGWTKPLLGNVALYKQILKASNRKLLLIKKALSNNLLHG